MGSPQLSMHSVREMMGTKDVLHGCLHLKSVFETRALIETETGTGVKAGDYQLLDS